MASTTNNPIYSVAMENDNNNQSLRKPTPRPNVLPTIENVLLLEKYILEQLKNSAFNKSTPFPSLSTKPAHIHLKSGSHHTCLWDPNIESAFYHTWDYLILCAKNGIVINKWKFQFCCDEVLFARLKITKTGIAPSDHILSTIQDFPTH